ncbi:pyridoxal-dependent decarboxylase conserved domain-containing protein [Lipomyces arxii]|uniref:pyridoxal-dependent decarboxylase conserved domain-containing protein n=1 Tax=Lipomyces arxii TaxID=56418 RepID=UPI0034CF5939
MDPEEYRKAAYASVDYIVDYYKNISQQQVLADVKPGYLREMLPTSMPTAAEKWTDIQADFENKIVPGLTHWQAPNFLAFFPANTSFPSILGETYSAAFSAPAFNWICSPAITELETIVLDWLAKAMSLPDCFLSNGEGGGVIQGSASESVVATMVAARDRYLRDVVGAKFTDETEREDAIAAARGKLVAFSSDQTHSSTHKAALIAGVKYAAIKTSADEAYALTGARLATALEDAKSKGLMPFFVTVSLGTTAICAVDNIEEIGKVTKEYPEIWKHIDAAYSGAALICPEFQHYVKGMEHYDSFDMNMHKWLLVNFDASCLFIRKRKDLIDALSVTPPYLRNSASDSGLVIDYRDWQIPLGRRFRSLKIWFVMRTYGLTGMQEHIRKTLAIGEHFTDLVRSRPDVFTIVTKPAFGLTVFQVLSGTNSLTNNEITKTVADRINGEHVLYLTASPVDGRYCIRVVTGSPWATTEPLTKAFDYILKLAEEERAK